MNIDELTLGQIKEIKNLWLCKEEKKVFKSPYTIGDNWFFRTVTNYLHGEVLAITDTEIVLKGGTVVWVADTGRFTDFLKTGDASETEVYGDQDVVIGRGSIIDATRTKVNVKVVQK